MAHKQTLIPDSWDPLQDECYSPFNFYDTGPGAKLDRNRQLPRRITHADGNELEHYSLYVSGISMNINEVGLKNIFSNFGDPYGIKIISGKLGAKANVGFVSFSTLQEAQLAMSKLHKNYPYFLNVSFAKSSEKGNRITQTNESIPYCEEYELTDQRYIDPVTQYMAPDGLIEDSDLEGAVGYALHNYGGLYCDTYEYETPSVANLHWTCNRDGQRVIIGRGSHQNYGCRYHLPTISEDRRCQIEAVIKENVYYIRKNNGVYEYSDEEAQESNTGPCSYCHRITSLVCEQCSTTLYCSISCQMQDFTDHKEICSSGKDLRISTEGTKRCVAVKGGEAISSQISKYPENYKGREKYNTSSHDKKYDTCSTEHVSVCKKPDEVDYRFREKRVTELQKEPDRRMVGGDKKMNMQVHNKSCVIGDDYESKKENCDASNTFNRHNRTDKSFKNKHVDNRKTSGFDKPIEVNSRINEKVDRQNKNCSSNIRTQSRCDKKNSVNFRASQKSNNKDSMIHPGVVTTLQSSRYDSSNVCNKAENKVSPQCTQSDKSLSVRKEVNVLLPSGVFTEVRLSYVVECGEFWVQKSTDLSLIGTMTVELCEDIEKAMVLEAPEYKSKCAAKYYDMWYRGRVVSTEPLKVQFVDWGNTEEISSINDIKVLPEKFCKSTPMACRIRLDDGTPDEYLKKKDYEELKVKPLFKASDGAWVVEVERLEDTARETREEGSDVLVEVEKVESLEEAPKQSLEEAPSQSLGEASKESLEEACLKPKPGSALKVQTRGVVRQSEESEPSFMTKDPKNDALDEYEEPRKNFPTEDLELNKHIQVEVQKIEDENYWVILNSRKEKFSELLCTLQIVATRSNPLLPSTNDLCLAVHETLWARGFVKNEETLEVFFFDFGETVRCSLHNIKELPVEFHTSPPALAHKLCFAEITPNKYLDKNECACITVKPISKCDDGSWLVQVEETANDMPMAACEQIQHCTNKSILAHNVFTEVVLVGKQKDNKDMYYVQPQTMVTTLCEMNELLASTMKAEEFIPHVGTICTSLFEDVWCRCCVESVSQESVTVFYIDYGNVEENVLFERLQPIPEKYINIPQQGILVKVVQEECNENLNLYNKYFVRPVSKLSDGTQVVHIRKDYMHVEEDISITTADGQEKCASDKRTPLQSVQISPKASVKISYIYDASNICIQLADKNSVDSVEEILQEIGFYCQTAPLMDTQPLVGDFVACKYSKDNNWYRAEILEIQGNKFHILFIDYGNKSLVTLDNIRTLPAKYKNIPAQCIKIGLAECNATELTPAAQQCLYEFTRQTLTVDLKNSDLNSVVLETEDGLVINEKLKEHLTPSWKKALLANEDPTRNKLFFMEDLTFAKLSQGKVITLTAMSYCPPKIIAMCDTNTDLYKYVATTLTDEISDYCNSLPEQTYNPRENELCCVLSLQKDSRKWYRAVCLETKVDSSLLALVDFGKQYYAPHSCVRRFVPDFISTPGMAFFCSLEGVPEHPSEKLIEKMKSIFKQHKIYEVSVISVDSNTYSVQVPYIINALKSENLL